MKVGYLFISSGEWVCFRSRQTFLMQMTTGLVGCPGMSKMWLLQKVAIWALYRQQDHPGRKSAESASSYPNHHIQRHFSLCLLRCMIFSISSYGTQKYELQGRTQARWKWCGAKSEQLRTAPRSFQTDLSQRKPQLLPAVASAWHSASCDK